MYGVMRNIAHLCTRKNSQTWGPNAWEKVGIVHSPIDSV
jgi:chitin synthase